MTTVCYLSYFFANNEIVKKEYIVLRNLNIVKQNFLIRILEFNYIR